MIRKLVSLPVLEEMDPEANCVLQFGDHRPGLYLSPEDVALIHRLLKRVDDQYLPQNGAAAIFDTLDPFLEDLEAAATHNNEWRKTCRRFVIMRGVPGSGKSFEANRIVSEALASGLTVSQCSTDAFFMVPDGQNRYTYQFDPSKIGEYHQKNQEHARKAIECGHNVVVIDNTNTTSWEMRPYAEMACYGGYTIEFREPTSPWWLELRSRIGVTKDEKELSEIAQQFADRNVHGVPVASLVKMLSRWENESNFDQDILDFANLSRAQ